MKRLLFLALLLVSLIGGAVAWTNSVKASVETNISAGGMNGKAVTGIVNIGEPFDISNGKEKNTGNIELFQINLGDTDFSSRVMVEVILVNPEQPDVVLDHAQSNIKLQLYYPGSGHKEVTLDYDGSTVLPDNGPKAKATLNRSHGEAILIPSVTGVDTLYVLADLNSPPKWKKGDPQPNLQFYCEVRPLAIP